jgi:uncharacterized membrane protein YdfJ with MMPL/SSD domain
VLSLAVGTTVLVLLGMPLVGMRVGESGVTSLPAGSESKLAFTVLSHEFAGGLATQVQIVVAGPVDTRVVQADITRLRGMLAISGVTAALHARARSAAGLAVFGALTAVSALAALFLGVLWLA